jgi:F-type H+-transporting ATPase subunit b
MSPSKKRVLKLMALVYVVLVVAFVVYTTMNSQGKGIKRTLSTLPRKGVIKLTVPLVLESLDGKPVTPEVVDALLSAKVTVIGVVGNPEAVVGQALVAEKAVFQKATLPAETELTDALWKTVLDGEIAFHEAKAPVIVYVYGGGDIMGFDLTLIFVVLNFLGLFILLHLLLWDPITAMLDGRAETIKTDLDTASKSRQKAGALKTRYDKLILDSKQERQDMIAEGRSEGESERKRIVGTARDEADKIVARTREELEAAAEKARRDLQAEIGGLSVQLAERILDREVSETDNHHLVDDFLTKLGDVQEQ